ncbi:hypothetical protein HMPREF9943_01083 [Eggerthia catenaformis OT 569 = DSM 20559]|uniref:DUF304 domain-containing protein n=1 Tax=Eggerthia catenaformis OT 569 = DSM 20559 TaxID=999415 RepID=M2PLW4_9FIRM|nr:hypothetical protein [Eggerthia catenaformis]EMD16529.1 hypothetical protein HMPREF9943_01083 [Eggerthia catenaformis OT 569 = DSM 20559]
MELDFLQDEPKLILTYPHKSKFNMIGYLSLISSFFIIISILNYLKSYGSDFADKFIIATVLVCIPILIFFMGYYLFINAVKLELYENNVVKYYSYGSRGHSVLLFKFKLADIEQIKIKKRPFNCSKLTIKIKNPVFYGFHEKKLNKLINASIITDRKKLEFFMQQMEQFQVLQKADIEKMT